MIELWVLTQPLSPLLLNNHWTFSVECDITTLFINGKNDVFPRLEHKLQNVPVCFLTLILIPCIPVSYSPIMVIFLGCQKENDIKIFKSFKLLNLLSTQLAGIDVDVLSQVLYLIEFA